MATIKEITDKGAFKVSELRESQSKGASGNGLDIRYADKMGRQNLGTGEGEGEDPDFPEAAEYSDSDGDSGLPWE